MSFSKIQFRNSYSSDDFLVTTAAAFITHPLDYVRILIQLGYEPFDAYPIRTLLHRNRMALPGIVSYWKLIYRADGLFGLFRGFTFKLGYTLTNKFIYVNVKDSLDQQFEKQKPLEANEERTKLQSVGVLVDCLVKETMCKVVSISISYPLRVLVIRSCAQFIGKETIYNLLPSALRDIYSNEGLLGFYGGFVPFVLGECVTLWLSHSIAFLIEQLLVKSDVSPDLQYYITTVTNLFVPSFMYPFQVASTVMSVNGCQSLTKSVNDPQFVNWVECWQHLRQLGQLKRGSSLIFRFAPHISRKQTEKSL